MIIPLLLALAATATFRGDLQHTGVYDARGVPELHGVKWKFKTGGGVYSSPAIEEGVVFVGSADGNLYAVDAQTGAQKWRFATKGEKRFSAAHIHGILPETEPVPDPFDFYLSSPAVMNGAVYFGSGDGNVYALDAQTGARVWVADNKGSWVIGSPAVHDGKVYFTTSDSGMFHAVDARTGAEAFTLSFKWPMFSSPAVAGGIVYIGSHEGKLLAIDVAARKPAWIFQTDASKQNGPMFTSPTGAPNYAAAMSSMFFDDIVGSADGYLYAID